MSTPGCSSLYLFAPAVFGIFFDLINGETCMKAIRSDETGRTYSNQNGNSWRWVNFDCRTGCCGDKGNQQCCPEENNSMDNPGMITTVSVGAFLLVVSVVIIAVCCLCHRSRQKRSQRMRRRRNTTASTTPSTGNLPPSYEMSVAMAAADTTGSAFPAEVHSPPSYEEAVANSPTYSISDQAQTTSTHVQAHALGEQVHVRGRDNAAFSVRDETNNTSVSVIS